MPILNSGSTTTVTLGAYDSITLQNRSGQAASISVGGTVVNGNHSGSRTYGPYPSGGSVSLNAISGDLYYEVADGAGDTKRVFARGSSLLAEDGSTVSAGGGSGAFTLKGTVTLPASSSSLGAALPKTRSMLDRVRAGGRGLILINGDSTTLGYNLVALTNGSRRAMSAVVARGLRRLGIHAHTNGFCGDNAAGASNISAFQPNLTLGAGWGTGYAAAAGVNHFQNSTTNNALSWRSQEPIDTVFVDYITANLSGGDMTVDIGGSTLATLASAQATGYYTQQVDLGSLGLHTINIKRAAGATAQSYFVGMRCYNSSNPGVLVMAVGGNGKNTNELTTAGNYGYQKYYALTGADLVIAGEQINDWKVGSDVPVATHTTRINTMITQSLNAGATDCLLLDGPRSRSTTAALDTQEAYHAADLATAYAAGVPMVSFWDALGPNDNSAAQNLIYYDAIGHLTDTAYGQYGYGVASVLVNEFA